jgi:hypothetical protein
VGEHSLPGYRSGHQRATIRQNGNRSQRSCLHPVPVSVLATSDTMVELKQRLPLLLNQRRAAGGGGQVLK